MSFLFCYPLHATDLYFYNPEININDFRSLKTSFDNYLSTQGTYQFQPFNDKVTFEQFLQTEKKGLFFLSSWHYLNLLEQGYSELQPVLVGTIDDEFTYTKILSTKKNIRDINTLDGKRIASSGNEEYTEQMLNNMIKQESFKILTVPKDIDALMSVLFGMAQGALTARNSLETLAKLNPKKFKLLQQHVESQAIILPLIVAYQAEQKFVQIIENMVTSNEGQAVLGMLGINGWKRLNKKEFQQLYKQIR